MTAGRDRSGRPAGGPCAGDAGSALLLVPAGVLVLVILASLALDAAVVFTAQRQLADAASAAANDAVTAALDEASFYDCGALRVDAARARQVGLASVAARSADIVAASAQVTVGSAAGGRPTVTVQLDGHATTVFRPALGAPAHRPVSASATAVAQPGAAAPSADCGG